MGGEGADAVVPAVAGGVVQQQAYTNATVSRLRQLVDERAGGEPSWTM